MSDRIKGLIVALDKNYREEDIKIIEQAIMQIKGVIGVKENKVNADDYINTVRVTKETKEKLYKIIEEME